MTQTQSEHAAPETLLPDLDSRFEAAVSAKDTATLQSLLADDFVYTHSSGPHQPKRVYIDGVVTMTSMIRTVSDTYVEVHGGIAVTSGNVDFAYPDGRPTRYNRYAHVYRLRDGRWELVSHRTFFAPDRAPSST